MLRFTVCQATHPGAAGYMSTDYQQVVPAVRGVRPLFIFDHPEPWIASYHASAHQQFRSIFELASSCPTMATTVAVRAHASSGPPGQPDIGYSPDHAKYLERAKRRQETELLPRTLPPGFPQQLQSRLVWDGNDLSDTYDWNYILTPENLEEIESALRHFKGNRSSCSL